MGNKDKKTSGSAHDDPELLRQEIEELRGRYAVAVRYIRQKVDQLLKVMGTSPLKPEELDDATLIDLDPIGIISSSFKQVLRNLHEKYRELAIANEEIRAILESAGMGILVVDNEMNIVTYNDRLKAEFFGEDEDVLGTPCYSIVCRNDRYGRHCPFKRCFDAGGNYYRMEWVLHGRNYDVVGTPIRNDDGTISNIVLAYMDITERIRAEETIASERERLAVTLRSIGDGVITTDTHGTIVLMNKVAEDLTGWKHEEANRKPITEIFRIINQESRECCENPVETVLKTGTSADISSGTLLLTKEGEERVIADSVAPIRDRNSEIIGAVLVFRDITEKQALEERLRKAEKIESLGILAGGIAHDFNNLLSAVVGNLDIALMEATEGSKLATNLQQAIKAAVRAGDLTKQLLTFSKGGTPVKKAASIAELIRDSADFALRGSATICAINLPDSLWPVDIDEGQMSQVIHNLLLNGAQSMPNGGTIRIRGENIELPPKNPHALKEGKYVLVRFSDEGGGIPPDRLGRIFEPYFTTKSGGSGLGLTTSYSIMRAHEGAIEVESEMGKGSAFILYLPAFTGRIEQREPLSAEEPAQGVEGRILVMDDDEMIRRMVEDILRSLGYDVEAVADGEKALSAYLHARDSGRPFAAVIMDLTIPGGLGGKETILRLREIDPAVKAIVSSGYSSDDVMANYKEYGFSGAIVKPYRYQQLAEELARVLQGNSA